MYHESDLYILTSIIGANPRTTFIFDPEDEIINDVETGFLYIKGKKDFDTLKKLKTPFNLINVSMASTFSLPVDFGMVNKIISLNFKIEEKEGFHSKLAYYTLSPLGKMSWIVSDKYKNSDFLYEFDTTKKLIDVKNLYSVFPITMKYIRMYTGNMMACTDGRIQFLTKDKVFDDEFITKQTDTFSTNVQNALTNGQVNIFFQKEKRTTACLKIPVLPKSKEKLQNEVKILSRLSKNKSEKVFFPESRKIENGYLNIFQTDFKKISYNFIQRKLYDRYLEYITLYNSNTHETQKIDTFIQKYQIDHKLYILKSRISTQKFPSGLAKLIYVKLFTDLAKSFNSLDKEKLIPVGLVNTALIPGNLFFNGSGFLSVNWEQSEKLPLLFDVFEYLLSYIEDFEYPNEEYLFNDLEVVEHATPIASLLKNKNIGFKLHFLLFLLYRLPDKMTSFLDKNVTTPEENTVIAFWKDALDYISK
jgi:hypothetical protein